MKELIVIQWDSGVENEVPTFALPTHGLIVGTTTNPGICN